MDDQARDGQIPTNLRLLLVLEALAEAGSPVTPTEVNQTLGLPKPTIHRLFATLEAEGFIQREIDGRGYCPGRRLRVMSAGILSSLRIRTARVAILTALAEAINETCNISLPDLDAMIYLERVETKWPLRIQLPVGSRVPFYCTASGKMYLSSLERKHLENYLRATELSPRAANTITAPGDLVAELDRVRARGYATDNEEFMDGMIAVAVPIRDSFGRLVSALSFHAPLQRLSLDEAINNVDRLNAAADKLSALISTSDL
ncbi:IclR family transcriptional regulator [Martelella lutilitoris]|uniref:IclR family transcriptional regulator n=1 Tax=Martelella lutilitoris TaxID=2583532 RepID=A0A5C4JSN7_9HYPH|nr:IclR family transcriptional regulator [Martelella lutilitoris]TNB48232.1 IclR family transcriptional regulator [Martelella lutilitoris]